MPALVTYPAYEPQWIASGGILSPRIQQYLPAEVPLWRAGDFLTVITTGTIVTPTGGTATSFTNATGALTAGPSLGSNPTPFNVMSTAAITQGVVTVTGVASTGAPARTIFGVVTYGITNTTESQSSVPFIINLAPGFTATITVASAGAPAGATTYSAYLGAYPGNYVQNAAVNVALGTASSNIANPLTNSQGVNKFITGTSTTTVGMADCDSDAYFAGILGAQAGGSGNTGKRSLFGATQSFSPGWTNDPFMVPVVKAQVGFFELSLVQAYFPTLNGSTVYLTTDTASGYMVATTTVTGTAFGTIQDLAYGPGFRGGVGDAGARVRVQAGAIAV